MATNVCLGLIEGEVGVYLLYKHKHRLTLEWPRSALVAVSEQYCSVNKGLLHINGKECPLYLRADTFEVFLGDYSTLKSDRVTYVHHTPCEIGVFPFNSQFQFAQLLFVTATSCQLSIF